MSSRRVKAGQPLAPGDGTENRDEAEREQKPMRPDATRRHGSVAI
jgi:hypothetical protein